MKISFFCIIYSQKSGASFVWIVWDFKYTRCNHIVTKKVPQNQTQLNNIYHTEFLSHFPFRFSNLQQINANDDSFWDQFWSDHSTTIQDTFALVPSSEIRTLRHDNPANLATLCYKATERLVHAVDNSCRSHSEQQAGMHLSN